MSSLFKKNIPKSALKCRGYAKNHICNPDNGIWYSPKHRTAQEIIKKYGEENLIKFSNQVYGFGLLESLVKESNEGNSHHVNAILSDIDRLKHVSNFIKIEPFFEKALLTAAAKGSRDIVSKLFTTYKNLNKSYSSKLINEAFILAPERTEVKTMLEKGSKLNA
jgi:hypothetical protein